MNTCFSLTMGFSDYGSPLSPHRGQAWSVWKFITSAAVLCPWWTGVVGKYPSYLTTHVGKLWGTCPTLSLRVLHWDWAPVSHRRTDFMAHSSLAVFLSLSSEVSFTSQVNYSHLDPCLWPLSGAAQPKGRFGLEHSHPAPPNPLPNKLPDPPCLPLSVWPEPLEVHSRCSTLSPGVFSFPVPYFLVWLACLGKRLAQGAPTEVGTLTQAPPPRPQPWKNSKLGKGPGDLEPPFTLLQSRQHRFGHWGALTRVSRWSSLINLSWCQDRLVSLLQNGVFENFDGDLSTTAAVLPTSQL